MPGMAGKSEILPASHPGVDAENFALHIQERTAAVAPGDRRVGLDPRLVVRGAEKIFHVARQIGGIVHPADNARGRRKFESLGMSKGNHFASLTRQAIWLELEH